MKTIVNSKIQKIEFFIYYIYMFFFNVFVILNSIIIGSCFYMLTAISGAIAILSIIILYSYYHKILHVKYLLKAYIILIIILFIGSAVLEICFFNIKIYPFLMKISLYIFCTAIPIKHLFLLNNTLSALHRGDH